VEDVTESESTTCESFMRWNLPSCAVVLRIPASRVASSSRLKLLRSFFDSSNLRKSPIVSSSVLTSPELAPSPSFKNLAAQKKWRFLFHCSDCPPQSYSRLQRRICSACDRSCYCTELLVRALVSSKQRKQWQSHSEAKGLEVPPEEGR
jgi:hypothetical protein